jgi:hypothetical protein
MVLIYLLLKVGITPPSPSLNIPLGALTHPQANVTTHEHIHDPSQ